MSDTKKLLSVDRLKKYFPIARRSIFQRDRLYVRANEEITLDIFEGETVGVVGESGCGKSTLGRVILQLYSETAGSTLYYGRSLWELAPRYVEHTLKHAEKYIERYRAAQKKAEEAAAVCEKLGDKASFFQLQYRNLKNAKAQSSLGNVAKILGGWVVAPNVREGAALLLEEYKIRVSMKRTTKKIEEIGGRLKTDFSIKTEKGRGQGFVERRKIARFEKKKRLLEDKLSGLKSRKETVLESIKTLKSRYADNAEFLRFEEYLDDGVDLARLTYGEMRFLRKDLQIIFQDPYSSLDPRMTVGQIIEEGLITHKFFKRNSAQMRRYVLEIMQECGLQEHMLHRYPHQFSGGQRQRICIARALAVKPRFVVCDECVSALDVSIQSQIINLLQELKEREKLTYLFISHDLSVVRYVSDRIAVMYLGNIVELSSAEEIFEDPRHPYTVALLSAVPTTETEETNRERILLEGSLSSPVRPPSGCKFHTRCFMACKKCKRVPPELKEVKKGHFVACHFPERKIAESGEYLFSIGRGKTENKTREKLKEEPKEELKESQREEPKKADGCGRGEK